MNKIQFMDIGSKNGYPASALSNFAPHPFELDGVKYSKDNDVFDVENINNWPARPFTSFITEYGKPYIVSTPWYVSTPYYERRSE